MTVSGKAVVGSPDGRHPRSAEKLSLRAQRIARESTTAIFVGVVLLWLVAGPLLFLFNMSVRTGTPASLGQLTANNYQVVYSSNQTWPALSNTVIYAVLVSIVSLVIAAAFAWFVERTDMPGRGFAWIVMLLPLAVPGLLASMSWILMLAPNNGVINVILRSLLSPFGVEMDEGPINIYSLGGMIFIEGIRGANTLFLMLVGAFRMMDPALEDAAIMSGASKFDTVRRVTSPLMLPAILAAAIYSFLGNLTDFDTPLLIGLPAGIFLLPTYIYFTAYVIPAPNWGIAAAYASIFLIIMVALVIWYYRVVIKKSKKFATVSGKGYRPQRISLGRWRWVALGSIASYSLVAIVVPAGILLWASLLPIYQVPSLELLGQVSLVNYAELLDDSRIVRATANTFILAFSVATLTMMIAFFVSWAVVRIRVRGAAFMDTLAFAPNAIPGVAIGMGLAIMYLHPAARWLPIYGSLSILIIALTTSFLAFATRISNGSMVQVSLELEEAAWISGATKFRTLVRVITPILLPTFLAGWIWVVAHAFRNLTIPLLLATPESEVLSTRLYLLWTRNADFSAAAALGICLMLLLGLLTFASRRLITRGFTGD